MRAGTTEVQHIAFVDHGPWIDLELRILYFGLFWILDRHPIVMLHYTAFSQLNITKFTVHYQFLQSSVKGYLHGGIVAKYFRNKPYLSGKIFSYLQYNLMKSDTAAWSLITIGTKEVKCLRIKKQNHSIYLKIVSVRLILDSGTFGTEQILRTFSKLFFYPGSFIKK